MISDPVWTSPPKSFMMASPILITMHPAADSDQTAHMVMNMEGVQKRCLCSGEAMDYNISSYYELSVESKEESVCENVPDMYNVHLKKLHNIPSNIRLNLQPTTNHRIFFL